MKECFGKMALDVTLFEDPYEAIPFQKLLQERGVTVYIIMTSFDLVQFLTENSIVYFSFRSLRYCQRWLNLIGYFYFSAIIKKNHWPLGFSQIENENTLCDIASINGLYI